MSSRKKGRRGAFLALHKSRSLKQRICLQLMLALNYGTFAYEAVAGKTRKALVSPVQDLRAGSFKTLNVLEDAPLHTILERLLFWNARQITSYNCIYWRCFNKEDFCSFYAAEKRPLKTETKHR